MPPVRALKKKKKDQELTDVIHAPAPKTASQRIHYRQKCADVVQALMKTTREKEQVAARMHKTMFPKNRMSSLPRCKVAMTKKKEDHHDSPIITRRGRRSVSKKSSETKKTVNNPYDLVNTVQSSNPFGMCSSMDRKEKHHIESRWKSMFSSQVDTLWPNACSSCGEKNVDPDTYYFPWSTSKPFVLICKDCKFE